MTDVTPRALLQATADYFKTHNWCGTGAYGPGPFGDAETAVCLVVGINRAAWSLGLSSKGNDRLFHTTWDILERHLGSGMVKWNETPGRTKEQVIAALEAAAQL